MPDPPPDITDPDAQCPLLAADQVGRDRAVTAYRRAFAVYQEVAAKAPAELQAGPVAEAAAALAKLGGRLTRQSYRVGFLGASGIGKSTILNYLSELPVAKKGTGSSTTCVVSRIRKANATGLTLHYFTAEQYRDRRRKLAEGVGLHNTDGLTEDELLAKLVNHRPAAGAMLEGQEATLDDVAYLRTFLLSYKQHREVVKPTAAPVAHRYDDRDALLNHGSALEPTAALLLREAEVAAPVPGLPSAVELVDCPGLGARRGVDRLLTTEYIPHLDGAVLVTEARLPVTEVSNVILKRLTAEFGPSLASRVWVVVHQMDGPQPDAKLGANGQPSVFDNIARLADADPTNPHKPRIPLSQVLLGCEDVYQVAKDAGGTAPRAVALAKLKLAPEHEPALDAILSRHPDLQQAFEQLLKDGSVSRLRHLIKDVVGRSVARQVIADADTRLPDIEAELRAGVPKEVSAADRQAANRWWAALNAEVSKLYRRDHPLAAAADALTAKLATEFNTTATPDALGRLTADELLGDHHDLWAGQFEDAVGAELGSLAAAGYDRVRADLAAAGLPPLPLGDDRDPLTVWDAFKAADRCDPNWLAAGRPRFNPPGLLGRLKGQALGRGFDAAAYRQLVHAKLRLAGQQGVQAVVGRLRDRLDDLRTEVKRRMAAPPAA